MPDWSDAFDWIGHQPWSNQRIGSFGCSYLGEQQIILAWFDRWLRGNEHAIDSLPRVQYYTIGMKALAAIGHRRHRCAGCCAYSASRAMHGGVKH